MTCPARRPSSTTPRCEVLRRRSLKGLRLWAPRHLQHAPPPAPQVRIGLTTLAYAYEGMRVPDCAALLGRLKGELERQRGPLVERPAYVTYEQVGRLRAEEAQRVVG